MAVEQKQQENYEVHRRMELDQLVKEMAAHFHIKQDIDQQAHFRSWRHALKGHVTRYREFYYEEQ